MPTQPGPAEREAQQAGIAAAFKNLRNPTLYSAGYRRFLDVHTDRFSSQYPNMSDKESGQQVLRGLSPCYGYANNVGHELWNHTYDLPDNEDRLRKLLLELKELLRREAHGDAQEVRDYMVQNYGHAMEETKAMTALDMVKFLEDNHRAYIVELRKTISENH